MDRGVALEQKAPAPLDALGASVLMGPKTTSADVDAWEARVELLLSNHPRWLSLFRYDEPPTTLDRLGMSPLFHNKLKDRLHRRTVQLEKIIREI